jgi:hypothetical protein
MSTSHAEAAHPISVSQELVNSDFLALASHMTDCERSRGRFFAVRTALESLHAMTARRIVTTGAIVICGSLGLLALV